MVLIVEWSFLSGLNSGVVLFCVVLVEWSFLSGLNIGVVLF